MKSSMKQFLYEYIKEDNFIVDDIIKNYKYSDNLEKILRDMQLWKFIIDNDFKDIDDKKFYEIITNFYDIRISKKDILECISRLMKNNFSNVQILKLSNSNLEYFTDNKIKNGDIELIVATVPEIQIEDRYYENQEIRDMVSKRQIFCLYRYRVSSCTNDKDDDVKLLHIPSININLENKYCSYYSYRDYFLKDNMFKLSGFSFNDSVFDNLFRHELLKTMRYRYNKERILDRLKIVLEYLDDEDLEKLFIAIKNDEILTYEERRKYLIFYKKIVLLYSKIKNYYFNKDKNTKKKVQ